MNSIKLEIPCAYQGGKQRIAKDIVDIFFKENNINDNTKFYDLCCGSGAISIELVNRGVNPNNITMLDRGVWGLFWQKIGQGEFDLNKFEHIVNLIPKDISMIQSHMKKLSKQPANIDTEYVYLLLQASSFGSKQIWIDNNQWKNTSFRRYWIPTPTSNRRSPVNPMMPMPDTLLSRVRKIAQYMKGVKGIYDDIFNLTTFEENAIVYIDPPYSNTTSYRHTFDVFKYIKKIIKNNIKIYISEGVKISNKAYLISKGRSKGGISGERKNMNEEWLNVYEGGIFYEKF